MIFIPDTVLLRSTSIVLTLYVGAFLGQAPCVLHASHGESPMRAGMDHPAVHASSSTAAHSPSQHGEHPGPPAENHSGGCAVVACGSAITATLDHGLEPLSRLSNDHVAYLGGITRPDAETVPPPPRLG